MAVRGVELLFAVLDDLPVDRVALALDVAEQWREGLASLGRNEFGVAALDRVIAVLRDGETDPGKLGIHGLRLRLGGAGAPPPDIPHNPDQLALGE